MRSQSLTARRSVRIAALTTLIATAGFAVVASPASAKKVKPAPSSHTVVATGLNNPRGLATEGDHLVYVAEAGTGGAECFESNSGAEKTCIGLTGSITRFEKLGKKKQKSVKIVDGLLSISNDKTGEVVGIDGVDVEGHNRVFGVMAESTQGLTAEFSGADGGPWAPTLSVSTAVTDTAGRLIEFRKKHGVFTNVASVNVGGSNWDWTNSADAIPYAPTGQFPDANPYAVLTEGSKRWVVDAGSNTVSLVKRTGKTYTQKIIAYIPNPAGPSDAAPTCIAKRGRYLYVGDLNFAAFYGSNTAAATIWRIDTKAPAMTAPTAWATGLNPITGCGFAKDQFYVVQIRTVKSGGTNGAITRIGITKGGAAADSATWQTFGEDLVDPSGFARYHNTILVSNKSTSTGSGEIWQFRI